MYKLMTFFAILFTLLFIACTHRTENDAVKPGWPDIEYQAKPWTRWWWQGNLVDEEGLTKALKKYAEAGLGGVEITCIYGVKGQEDTFIHFTSDRWVDLFHHTLREAKKLDMGVDLALASGWPFGGPWVNKDDACKMFIIKQYELKAGDTLNEKITHVQEPLVRAVNKRIDIDQLSDPVISNGNLQELALDQVRFPRDLPLQTLMAYNEDNEAVEISSHVAADGTLNWVPVEGHWKLYALFMGWHGKQVERAGPGGEGDVIDHFSEKAIQDYLAHFDEAFRDANLFHLRAYFNDSYEVDDAYGESNWTHNFFAEFKQRRGYDLRNYLSALARDGDAGTISRVYCDYRETISDLILDNFTKPWALWARRQGKLIRNQAHGSPANILDLYAASDIPETEGTDFMAIKFASSAAHTSGKKLVAAEAATWLNEHFLATLAETKENVDRYFLGGVNHIVYHGTAYSPDNEPWPGRMFYASVHYAPSNTIWRDFPVLNNYVARTQSFLQKSKACNDVLLYYPVYDIWSEPWRHPLYNFKGRYLTSPAHEVANMMQEAGYTYDFISDRQITNTRFSDGLLATGKNEYKTILIPEAEYIPLHTFKQLLALAKKGGQIIFYKSFPDSIPGLLDIQTRQQEYNSLIMGLAFEAINTWVRQAKVGHGKMFIADSLELALQSLKIKPEDMVRTGLDFIRKKMGNTLIFFIKNNSDSQVHEFIPVANTAKSVILYNPMNNLYGKVPMKIEDEELQVFLQLNPGETCILQLFNKEQSVGDYAFYTEIDSGMVLDSSWSITFKEGGPVLPETQQDISLSSWTNLDAGGSEAFSGTALYTTSFKKPNQQVDAWKLDLGEVHESVEVYINGIHTETLIGPDYSVVIQDSLWQADNTLDLYVSNLMANRIIDMENSGEEYRKFYNINFPANKRENVGPDRLFTTRNWEPLPSGLIGPVRLIPMK